MKSIIITLACLFTSNILLGQTQEVFLEAKGKFCVRLSYDTAHVYNWTVDYNKHIAIKRKILRCTNILVRNAGHNFADKSYTLAQEGNVWYLAYTGKKKVRLDTTKNTQNIYYALNSGYYTAEYSKMSEIINKANPRNRHSYYNTYSSWNTIPNQYAHYLDFKPPADKRIKFMQDSILKNLAKYEHIRNFIAQNASTASYETLKDSLSKLSTVGNVKINSEMKTEMWLYYIKAVHEIAEQKPEFFFKLAEDLPDNQHDIFFSINQTEKQLLVKLQLAKGNEIVKKKFFKEHRRDKRAAVAGSPLFIAVIGAIIVAIGLAL